MSDTPVNGGQVPLDNPIHRLERELATLRERLAERDEAIGQCRAVYLETIERATKAEQRAERAEAMAEQNAKDAERYRWLRDESWKHDSWSVKYCVIAKKGDGLDAAIDARKP